MKKIVYLLCVLALVCAACKNKIDFEAAYITNTTITANSSSAEINFTVSGCGTVQEAGVYISSEHTPTENDECISTTDLKIVYSDYFFTIGGLSANTTYLVRPFVRNALGSITGGVVSFTTSGTVEVNTKAATNIKSTSAQLNAEVRLLGENVRLEKRGFVYSTGSYPTLNGTNTTDIVVSGKAGDYYYSLTGLSSNTHYYYRGYAVVDGEIMYGNVVNFTTLADSQGYYTVEQIMDIYNSLGLAVGYSTAETFTVRGYVTHWWSGYPDYQNASFQIDDTPNGSISLLECYRLVAQKTSDERVLKVGDYVEVRECQLQNYRGNAELKGGTYTVLFSAPAGMPSGVAQ